MVKYIDAHCHIGECMTPDSICRLHTDPRIVGHICNSSEYGDWDAMRQIAMKPGIYPCIGVHPWHIESALTDWDAQMENILSENPSFMVGEIGLDKLRPDFARQTEFFVRQIDIAYKYNRVAHVHCVGAWDKILEIFKMRNGKIPPAIVAHSFAGSPQIIEQTADRYNVYFSYSPAIFDTARARIRECAAETPQNRILAESDGDLADAARVIDVINQIAKIRGVAMANMADVIYNNTMEIINNG